MKICWGNLENLYLPTKKSKYLKNKSSGTKYYFVDECEVCKEPYLSSNDNSKTCSAECKNLYCSDKLKGRKFTEEHKKNISRAAKGRSSSFKGKSHTEEQKLKWSKIRSGGMYVGRNNPRYGDHRTWDELYGKERADELRDLNRSKSKRDKISKSQKERLRNINSLSNNTYSFGTSGWYKNIYFRSCLELSFLLWADDNKYNVKSAENSNFSLSYMHNNERFTYFPDFYIEDTGEVVEIKPSRFLNYSKIKSKSKYANNKFGEKYLILTEKDLNKIGAPYIDKKIINKLEDENIITTMKNIK